MTWPQPTPGVDRLVMLAAGADLIDAVRWLSSPAA
jgi:elongation factor P--beta-lysine ligase